MYVEEEPCAEEDTWQHPVCLYGCPATKEFQGSDLLQSCSVEIVSYE